MKLFFDPSDLGEWDLRGFSKACKERTGGNGVEYAELPRAP